MAKVYSIVLGMLILQIYVHAAPSDVSKPAEVTAEEKEPTLDSVVVEEQSKNSGQRQKRWYPHSAYGFSSINPFFYPNNVRRDDAPETGAYGYEDPFIHIHRRLQEIAGFISQPNYPPAPPVPAHFPVYVPVVYVPPAHCACPPAATEPPLPSNDKNETNPNIENRVPDIEDVRQNWGIIVNNTGFEDDDEEDVGRPISFVPIRLNRTMSRPVPPVEHGSVQAGGSNDINEVKTQTTTSEPFLSVQGIGVQAPSANAAPTTCDAAVLSCCHQALVTYECFSLQGCPDPKAYGNPCDANVILQVIERFQRFYGQRTG